MSKERPILFSAPMVRALLDGSKTQTRRVVKPAKCKAMGVPLACCEIAGEINQGDYTNSQYGQPGDRLWVRETYYAWGRWETRFSAKKGRDEWHFVDLTMEARKSYLYAANGQQPQPMGGKRHKGGITPTWWKRPAIFIPHAASRITLEVTGVRVERLQDISEADALAEGVNVHPDHHSKPRTSIYSPVQAYRDLWESINDTESWEANPWVWVVEFKVVKP